MRWLDGLKEIFGKTDTSGEREELEATLKETLRRSVDSAKRFDDLLLEVLRERNRETAQDQHWALLRLLNERFPLGDTGQESWKLATERLLTDLPKLY